MKRTILFGWFIGYVGVLSGLKIETTCLGMFLANSEHLHRVVAHLYFSLNLTRTLSGFVGLVRDCPAFPFKNALIRTAAGSVSKMERYSWACFKKAIEEEGFDNNDLFDHADILRCIWATPVKFDANEFQSIEYFPDFVNLERFGPAMFANIIKQLGDNANLLSTKTLCQSLAKTILLDDEDMDVLRRDFWMLVDTECLEINGLAIRVVCNADAIDEPAGFAGMEPIVRMMHAIALGYGLDDHESDYFFAQELSEFYTAFHSYSMAIAESSPLKELYMICVKSFRLFLQQLQLRLPERSTSMAFYRMIWNELVDLRKTSLTINRVLVRFMIVLLGKKPELAMITEYLGEILAQPAYLIPRKELFSFLVVLSKRFSIGTHVWSDDESSIRAIKALIWNHGLGRSRQQKLLLMFPQYFGHLSSLLEDDEDRIKVFRALLLRSGFHRPHVMSLEDHWYELGKIQSYIGGYKTGSPFPSRSHRQFPTLESKRIGTLEQIQIIVNDHFVQTDKGVLPRIDIHLRVELLFWNLIEYALVLKVRSYPRIHPAYIKHAFFGQGGIRYYPKDLVQVLLDNQFSSQTPMIRQIEYFHGLEHFYHAIMNRQGQSVKATLDDLKDIFRRPDDGIEMTRFDELRAKVGTDEMWMHADLMARHIWNAKRGRIIRRLWVGLAHQDDIIPLVNGFQPTENS